MYDFDLVTDRKNTGCVKWDTLGRRFGRDGLMAYWIADMDFPAAPCITEALQKRAEHPVYGYSFPQRGYKQAICDWYKRRHGMEVKPDWILPGANTVTSLTVALQAVTRPGEKCLALTPAYDPFFDAVRLSGRELVTLELKENDRRYELDFAEFEKALKGGVRCLILCNPNNPGGKVWTGEELERIAQLCERYQVFILSDDVHCDWVFAPNRYVPITTFEDAAERTVIFTAPSKTFNLAGIGNCNLIVPGEELRERIQKALTGMFIRGSNTFAYAAVEAAYEKAAPWLEEVKEYVWKNAEYAGEYLALHAPGLRMFDQQSTFMIWIDCRSVETDGKKICRTLAEEYGIVVNDGGAYGAGGDGFIRLNIACPRVLLEIALQALADWYVDRTGNPEGKEVE
ncbi:MAG: PatB family C-S lyase [Eubacteriales bacterium]|nr:PatB family C-S lyase [Eubacteriales bacterium]